MGAVGQLLNLLVLAGLLTHQPGLGAGDKPKETKQGKTTPLSDTLGGRGNAKAGGPADGFVHDLCSAPGRPVPCEAMQPTD